MICVTVFVSLVILLLTETSFGKDISPNEGQCFKNSNCETMVVQLEDYDRYKEMVSLLKEENSELDKKIQKLNEIIKLQEIRINDMEYTIDSLNRLIGEQKTSYEKAIEEAKPSFFYKVKLAVEGAGVGSVLTVIALIALGAL